MNSHVLWKLLLVTSILIGASGLLKIGSYETDISGDGIPNRPQSDRIWDQTVKTMAVVILSAIIAIYSGVKLYR